MRRSRRGPFPGGWLGVVVACVALVMAAAPAGAMASRIRLGGSVYRLSVKGTNGYRLRLSTYENNLYHRISLTAENEAGQFARYSVEGIPRDGRIDATFPGLGEIKVKMHRGKVEELPPPKGCSLPKAVIESGVFEGEIRFRGEKGFTEVDTEKANGSIERSRRQECQAASRPVAESFGFSAKRGAFPTDPPSHFTVLQLTRGALTVYAEGVYGTTKATFSATAHERRDGMGIVRVSPGVSSEGDLEADGDLTRAVVAPPVPFLGTATYVGPEQQTGCELPCPAPQGQMSGSLRVPLPGLGVLPLTGPEVVASLHEDTLAY